MGGHKNSVFEITGGPAGRFKGAIAPLPHENMSYYDYPIVYISEQYIMHKYLFITLILIFTFQCLYADSDNFELSLSTGFSTMYGSVHEYVYDAGGKASRLDWEKFNLRVVY